MCTKYGIIRAYRDEYHNLDGSFKMHCTQTEPNSILNPELMGL